MNNELVGFTASRSKSKFSLMIIISNSISFENFKTNLEPLCRIFNSYYLFAANEFVSSGLYQQLFHGGVHIIIQWSSKGPAEPTPLFERVDGFS